MVKANANRTDANATTPANFETNVPCQRDDPRYASVATALLTAVLKAQLPPSNQGVPSGVPTSGKRPTKKARVDTSGKQTVGLSFYRVVVSTPLTSVFVPGGDATHLGKWKASGVGHVAYLFNVLFPFEIVEGESCFKISLQSVWCTNLTTRVKV